MGGVFATIKASSDAAYRRLISKVMEFYVESLFNLHWGEQLGFGLGGILSIAMVQQGLDQQEAEATWRPFFDWVSASPQDFSIVSAPRIISEPARRFWDPVALKTAPGLVRTTTVPTRRPTCLLGEQPRRGRDSLARLQSAAAAPSCRRHQRDGDWPTRCARRRSTRGISLHFNKGLAGGTPEVIAAARDTATVPGGCRCIRARDRRCRRTAGRSPGPGAPADVAPRSTALKLRRWPRR